MGILIGETPADAVYSNVSDVTVGATSVEIVAASTVPREAVIIVPSTADTGIRIAFGAAATANSPLIEKGESITVSGRQQVQAIRAGSVDVHVSIIPAVAGGWTP